MPGTEPVYLHPLLPTLGRGRPRPPWEPGPHRIGATRIRGVVLAARDLEAAVELYRIQLGLQPQRRAALGGARAAWYGLARTGQHVVLAQPTEAGELAPHLDRFGEGIFGIVLEVQDLEGATGELARRGTAVHPIGWLPGLVATDTEAAAQTRMVLMPGAVVGAPT
jgi:catechol 2,3-dioxygenase-like lactoylglutathione lyase family enzyme